MFKGFGTKQEVFHGIPNLNFQMNNEAYGFSGCSFWLDAAYGLNTQTDLAAVSKWVDRIRGLSFEQATAANQPRLVAADSSFNNLPVVQFQSAGRFLSSKVFGFNRNITCAVVFRKDTLPVQFNGLFSRLDTSSNTVALGNSTGTKIGVYTGTTTEVMVATTGDTNAHILVLTSTEIVLDGVQLSTGSWVITGSFNGIGEGQLSSNRGLNSTVAEILVFDNGLSSADCIRLSDNINSKYLIY